MLLLDDCANYLSAYPLELFFARILYQELAINLENDDSNDDCDDMQECLYSTIISNMGDLIYAYESFLALNY